MTDVRKSTFVYSLERAQHGEPQLGQEAPEQEAKRDIALDTQKEADAETGLIKEGIS